MKELSTCATAAMTMRVKNDATAILITLSGAFKPVVAGVVEDAGIGVGAGPGTGTGGCFCTGAGAGSDVDAAPPGGWSSVMNNMFRPRPDGHHAVEIENDGATGDKPVADPNLRLGTRSVYLTCAIECGYAT